MCEIIKRINVSQIIGSSHSAQTKNQYKKTNSHELKNNIIIYFYFYFALLQVK